MWWQRDAIKGSSRGYFLWYRSGKKNSTGHGPFFTSASWSCTEDKETTQSNKEKEKSSHVTHRDSKTWQPHVT
jgi:hypothetical protein